MVQSREIQPPDLILANSAWLQSFTRKLVRDADMAEDLRQEVLLAGLSKPDSSRTGPSRPWLAGVARNIAIRLARRETRRQQAEQAAQGRGTAPETADMVAEAELQSAAVQALLSLHEPYQTTLLARFMKGLSAREIAKRSGVPLETVRARIKRGLALLRAKLDREHGGRRGWLAPISIPLMWKQSTPALWGIVLMKMKTKVLVAAGILLAGLLGVWYAGSPPSSSPGVPQREDAGSMSAELSEPKAEADAGERTALVSGPAPQAVVEAASLLVRVTWEDTGLPAARVGLAVMEPAPTSALPKLVPTGEDGTALFEGLEPGTYIVDSNMEIGGNVELAAGERETMALTVSPGVAIRGVVVDRDGVPVAGAEILCVRSTSPPQWLHHLTDSAGDGSFSLGPLLRRRNLIGARAEGYGISGFVYLQDFATDANGEVVLRLVLPDSPATMTGTVTDPLGNAVADAWVQIRPIESPRPLPGGGAIHAPPRIHVLTDERGSFRVNSLRAGPVRVSAHVKGFSRWQGTVDCLPGISTHVNIQLGQGASLSGRVLDREGEPVEGASLMVPARYPSEVGVTETDAEGRYRFDGLPEGELRIDIFSQKLGSLRPNVFLIAGQEHQVDFTLAPGLQVRGVLLDHLGEPLEGWIVEAEENEHASRTDSRGVFALNNMESELYTLRVFPPRFVGPPILTLDPVFPGSGEVTIEVPLEALPSARILGRVLMPDGTPAAEVRFRFRDHIYPMEPVPESDEEGRFEIGPVPPGTYGLLGLLPGYLDADFGETTLVANEVLQVPDARLEYGASLIVRFASAEPKQYEGLGVAVVDGDGRTIQKGALQDTSVTFSLLPPGSHHLSVSGANIETQLLPIQLEAQKTLSLEIDLR